jgi:hypothetical protein
MADALDIRIALQSAEALAAAFEQAPEIVEDELYAATWEASLYLQREVQERTPVGVGGGGGLKGSIAAREPGRLADGVIGAVATSLAHAVPVELGTKPHMPPVKPLEDWARIKLGLDPKEAKGAAFAIGRKIAREGTEGAFMFTETFDEGEGQVQAIFGRALERITSRMAETR